MTPEEIQELLEEQQEILTEAFAEMLIEAKADIARTVDQKNGGLMAAMNKKFKVNLDHNDDDSEDLDGEEESNESKKSKTPKSASSQLAVKQLQQKLEQLEKDLQEKESKIRKEKLESHLTNHFGKTLNPSVAKKAFQLEYGDQIKEDNGVYYIEKGDDVVDLSEVVTEFLSTDFGKTLLPAKAQPKGLSLPQESKPSGQASTYNNVDDLLNNLFLDS